MPEFEHALECSQSLTGSTDNNCQDQANASQRTLNFEDQGQLKTATVLTFNTNDRTQSSRNQTSSVTW